MGSQLHFISLNTNGLQNFGKRSRLNEYLKLQKVDIIFLQETHFTSDIFTQIRAEFNEWDVFHSYGTSASRGC